MLPRKTALLLFLLLATIFFVTLIYPVLTVIRGGFVVDGHFTLHYLAGVFQNAIYGEGLFNSFKIALGSTALASLLAVPLAWLAYTYTFPGQKVLSSLVLVPMVLPPFVGAIGVMQMFGPYGAVNALLGCGPVDWFGQSRYLGVIILQALCFYPIIFLNVSAALANIDPSLDEAAQNLGAGTWTRFRRITLPLLSPGLFAGCTLVFIACFTELGTPLIMNYTRCAAVQIYDELKEISASPFPYALVTVVLCASVVLYLLSRWLLGGHTYAMHAKASATHTPKPVTGIKGILILAPFAAVAFLALLPHIGVILTSFSESGSWYRSVFPLRFTIGNYTEALGHGMAISAIRNSLFFAALAVAVNLLLGVGVAWVVTRSRLRFRNTLDALSMIPLAVPGLVMAFGFIAVSSWLAGLPCIKAHPSLAGMLDVRVNPTLFLVIAYAVRRLPYMVRATIAGLQQTSPVLEEAASNLGAPPATVLRRVTVPLIGANLVAGALLVFAFSMLEVSDSLMLAQKIEYYPVTKTIFELFQLIGSGRFLAAALGVWAMAFLIVTLVGCSVLLGKKLGALFRV